MNSIDKDAQMSSLLEQLKAMGFDEALAKEGLKRNKMDMDKTIAW